MLKTKGSSGKNYMNDEKVNENLKEIWIKI